MILLIPTWFLEKHGFRQANAPLAISYFKHTALVGLIFAMVYTGAGHYAAGAAQLYDFSFAWEKDIPLFPFAVWAYLSVILLFFFPPFALRLSDMKKISGCMCAAIVISGFVFVLFPAAVVWPRATGISGFNYALEVLHRIDKPVNTLPSLHVVFATVFCYFIGYRVRQARAWLLVWWFLICASVLFVHQHHILDIIAAWLLSAAVLSVMGPRSEETDVGRNSYIR